MTPFSTCSTRLRGPDFEKGRAFKANDQVFCASCRPDLADQAKVFRLLSPEMAIGVSLTSAWQLVPEASTSAIIVHHPAALYYMVKV